METVYLHSFFCRRSFEKYHIPLLSWTAKKGLNTLHRRSWIGIAVILMLVPLVGCQKKRPDGMPKLYRFQVKITQEGEPLAGAQVKFCSDSPELARWNPGSCTDDDGIADLWTRDFRGAPAGTYKVTVNKFTWNNKDRAKKEKPSLAPPKEIDVYTYYVEEDYRSEETTPLTITVDAKKQSGDIPTLDAGVAVEEVTQLKKK